MKVDILNIAGSKTGKTVELNDAIFGIEPNEHAMYLAVKQYLANQRQGTHKAKEKSEVSGSTKKLHRQKGTGGSRKGSIKNPLFRGGARVFGPRPRNYDIKLNKKVKELARKSALSQHAQAGNILVVENFTFDQPRTAQMVDVLNKLGLQGQKVAVLMPGTDRNVVLSGRNIPKMNIELANQATTYDLLNADKLLITEGGVEQIHDLFTKVAVAQ